MRLQRCSVLRSGRGQDEKNSRETLKRQGSGRVPPLLPGAPTTWLSDSARVSKLQVPRGAAENAEFAEKRRRTAGGGVDRVRSSGGPGGLRLSCAGTLPSRAVLGDRETGSHGKDACGCTCEARTSAGRDPREGFAPGGPRHRRVGAGVRDRAARPERAGGSAPLAMVVSLPTAREARPQLAGDTPKPAVPFPADRARTRKGGHEGRPSRSDRASEEER
jgi:hypothetical protein